MFETERCLINTLQESDFDDVKRLYSHSDVRKYLGGVRQGEAMTNVFYEMLHSSDDSFYWLIREKHNNVFIGLVSLDPHHDGVDYELSYQLLPNWWGAGYATEAVQKIIHFAFTELNLPKVIAETQVANFSSCKLMEKIGMECERTISRFGSEQAIYSIHNNL